MKLKVLALSQFTLLALSASAIITVPPTGLDYLQDFNSLAASGTANEWPSSPPLDGWCLYQGSGVEVTAYRAGTGSGNAGSFYSFGGTGSHERALGGVGSGGTYFGSPGDGVAAGWIAVAFLNASGGTLTAFTTSWNGEQWRNGGNTLAQSMVFQFGFGSTFNSVATWTSPGGNFDWSSPVTSSTAAAVDGNVAGRVDDRGGAIGSLDWKAGETLWLRWVELNDAGNDHGLAIDDFSLVVRTAPPANTPDLGSSAILLSIPLAGLFAIRRLGRRQF